MATIVDALVVTLGLDTKAFTRGKADASKATKTLTAEEKAAAAAIEQANARAAESFKKVRNEVLALVAIFTAGMGIKNFTESTINSAAGLGFMAKNLQMGTRELSAWQRAAERANGSAEGITRALQESQAATAKAKLGQFDDSTISFLRWGGSVRDLKDGNTYLLARSRIIAGMFNVDPARAKVVAQSMGIGDGEFDLLKQGPQAVLALVAAQEKNSAVTERQAAQALKLKNEWLDLSDRLKYVGTTIVLELMPFLEKLIQRLQQLADWVADHRADITKWVDSAVEAIRRFVAQADKAAESVGGWKNVLIGLAALKILSIASPLLQLATALGGVGTGLASIATSGPAALVALGGLAELARRSAFDKAIPPGPNHDQQVAEAMAGGAVTPDVKQPPPGGFGLIGQWWKNAKLPPRGIRNNNPGNIKYGDFAYRHGATGRDDNGFAVFPTMDAGVAAQRALLQTYLVQGNDTIRKVVSKYAPSSENDTSGYIDFVSKKLGISPDKKLAAGDIQALSLAMFARETGASAANAIASGSASAAAVARQIPSAKDVSSGSTIAHHTSSNETHINGPIQVYTQATDAAGIARDFGRAVSKYSFVVPQANMGVS